ncbi:MAG: hypothetical protein WBB37_10730 [bacterium]
MIVERTDFNDWHTKLTSQLIREVTKHESDRTLVLLCHNIIDQMLRDLLLEYIIPDNKEIKNDNLFGINRPLFFFGVRVIFAYRIGLISKDLFDSLNLLNGIREEMAHGTEMYMLNIDKINTYAGGFIKRLPKRYEKMKLLYPWGDIQGDFVFATELIGFTLHEKYSALQQDPTPFPWAHPIEDIRLRWLVDLEEVKEAISEWIYDEKSCREYESFIKEKEIKSNTQK